MIYEAMHKSTWCNSRVILPWIRAYLDHYFTRSKTNGRRSPPPAFDHLCPHQSIAILYIECVMLYRSSASSRSLVSDKFYLVFIILLDIFHPRPRYLWMYKEHHHNSSSNHFECSEHFFPILALSEMLWLLSSRETSWQYLSMHPYQIGKEPVRFKVHVSASSISCFSITYLIQPLTLARWLFDSAHPPSYRFEFVAENLQSLIEIKTILSILSIKVLIS